MILCFLDKRADKRSRTTAHGNSGNICRELDATSSFFPRGRLHMHVRIWTDTRLIKYTYRVSLASWYRAIRIETAFACRGRRPLSSHPLSPQNVINGAGFLLFAFGAVGRRCRRRIITGDCHDERHRFLEFQPAVQPCHPGRSGYYIGIQLQHHGDGGKQVSSIKYCSPVQTSHLRRGRHTCLANR